MLPLEIRGITPIVALKRTAALTVVGGLELLAVACGTPARGQILEESPTATSTATLEPTSTSTPEPTATFTPEPTDTPKPTSTRVPPTRTPVPPQESNPDPSQPPRAPEAPIQNNKRVAALLFAGVNGAREERGLILYSPNSLLQTVAEQYALFLHQSNFLDNPNREELPNPHSLRGIPQSRAAEQGYKGTVTEGIAWTVVNTGNEVEAASAFMLKTWVNSPPHYQDIINPSYIEGGMGCAFGKTSWRPVYPGPVPLFVCVGMYGKPN